MLQSIVGVQYNSLAYLLFIDSFIAVLGPGKFDQKTHCYSGSL